eukprot:Nk52_evm1s955 gene=Nk52_evmTU1s955
MRSLAGNSRVSTEQLSNPASLGGFGFLNANEKVRKMKQKLVLMTFSGRDQVWKRAIRAELKSKDRFKARLWNMIPTVNKACSLPRCFVDALSLRKVVAKPPEKMSRIEILRVPNAHLGRYGEPSPAKDKFIGGTSRTEKGKNASD